MSRLSPSPSSRLLCRLLAGAAGLSGIGLLPAAAGGPLSGAPSPHLRHHSNGPVGWLPWGNVAFTKAADEGKLIYCAIGYHACHWCRLMDRESFRDETIAALINKNFVPVKVDRLLRPDLDLVFRTYALATGNQTGWPVNVWITPAGNPVSVGSYFPPTTRGPGSPGLDKVIGHITKQWGEFPDYVHAQSGRDLAKIRERLERTPLAELEPPDPTGIRDTFYTAIAASFDPLSGGFDTAIKFPRPEILQALCALAGAEPDTSFRRKQAIKMVTRTLDGMLAGAVIDPLDGGLFRYANDASWRVPQFEKMLVDQARIAQAALDAFELTGERRYADLASGALDFAGGALRLDGGGYAASLAADGEQFGEYYTWMQPELESLLDADEFAALAAAGEIRPRGNAPPYSTLPQLPNRANILRAASPDLRNPAVGTPLASAKAKVLAARAARPAPARNDSVITGYNGLVVGALARAGKLLDRPDLLDDAVATASFLTSSLYDPETGRLRRAQIGDDRVGDGYADDYLFLARGLIELHLATGSAEALDTAIALQGTADTEFYDTGFGLYHLSPVAQKEALPLPLWSGQDTDLPSFNAYAILNLIDISRLRDEPPPERAQQLLKALAPDLEGAPAAYPGVMIGTVALSSAKSDR